MCTKTCYVVCPENLFSDCRVAVALAAAAVFENIHCLIRSGPATVKFCLSSNRYAFFLGSIKAFWRFQQGYLIIGSYVSGFVLLKVTPTDIFP